MLETNRPTPSALEAAVDLYDAVRQACSEVDWQRGANLSRGGRLSLFGTAPDGEVKAQIVTRGGALTPEVVLSPARRTWHCACPSEAPVCPHVAGVMMLLKLDDEARQGVRREPYHLSYALEREGRSLSLAVVAVRGDVREPVTTSVHALAARLEPDVLRVNEIDEQISALLRERRVGPILRPTMEPLLEALAEVDDLRLDGEKVKIVPPREAIRVQLVAAKGGGFSLTEVPAPEIDELFDNGAALCGDALFAVREVDLSDNDRQALEVGRVYTPEEVHTLVSEVLPELRERVKVDVRTKKLPSLEPMKPRVLFETFRDGADVVVRPELVYGAVPNARVEGDKLVHLGGPVPARDREAERALGERLRRELEMRRGIPKRARGEKAIAMAEAVRAFGGTVDGDALDACFIGSPLTLDLHLAEDEAELVFESEWEGETRVATVEAVLNALRNDRPLVALDAGGWAPLPEGFLHQHGHLVEDLLLASEGRKVLPKSAGADVARLAQLLGRPTPPDFTRLRELADGFAELPHAKLPEDFRGELRSYQQSGVDWLSFLSEAGLGGLLADDMGLGKTVQALCALGSPALVACPASVLHSWENEVRRFRPGLTVERYHSPDRRLDTGADVTLTTHAILRRDIELLKAKRWDTVIIDEAQQIKNPTSLVAQATYQLDARFRVALTGTPIENRLEDLWSLMRFTNPGLLGGLDDFRDRYARRITEGDAEAAARLRARVRPFITRRLKRDVESELPPRTDVVLRCTLDDEERAIYDAVRAATREEVVRELAAGRGVLHALEALLRLRQASCHAALIPGRSAKSSSKVRLLMETLVEILDEGHRALIFSQWTSLLDLIEPHLRAAEVDFVRLDGKTRNRGEVVDTFQSEDGPPVMLISLKAGGTGLTLTRADHVFLVDPWWNPAVEDQAADRIHRIGQEHPVLVHRLVAEDTVEERLLELQERKRALSESILDGGEGATGPAGLTREDLLELLA